MVRELREQIIEEEARRPYEHPEPKVVNYGTFQFNEEVLDVLDLLEIVEKGYTPEVLIAQLKAEAERLGRSPFHKDIVNASKEGRTASGALFFRCFGSWNKALQAAGLEINLVSAYTLEVLIAQLKAEAERLGRSPNVKDAIRSSIENRTAGYSAFLRYFGSWNNALEAAGLETNSNVGTYTPEILIAQLQTEAKRLGRVPSKKDVIRSSKEGLMASDKTFQDYFGSFPDAITAAGLKTNFVPPRFPEINPNLLISQLKAEAERLGKTPTFRDINKAAKVGRTVSPSAFSDCFGSWNNSLEAAGLTVNLHRLKPPRK